jgi:hypothetical protein
MRGRDWNDLAQDRNKGHAVLKAVTNFRVRWKTENLNSRGGLAFEKGLCCMDLISFNKIST